MGFLAVAPDPTDDQLDQVRQTLRQLTGRPEPEKEKLLTGFEDTYHGLLVGPCSAEALTLETECRCIEEIWMGSEDGFDCTYEEWVKLFREETRHVTTSNAPPVVDLALVLTPEQQAETSRAKETGEPIILEDGDRIERRSNGWLVIHTHDDGTTEEQPYLVSRMARAVARTSGQMRAVGLTPAFPFLSQ